MIFTAATTITLFWYLTNHTLTNIQRRFGETGNSPLKRRYISNSEGEKGEIPVILTHAINVRGGGGMLQFLTLVPDRGEWTASALGHSIPSTHRVICCVDLNSRSARF